MKNDRDSSKTRGGGLRVGDVVSVDVVDLAYGGDGVGRVGVGEAAGLTVFVGNAAVGDVLDVRIREVKRRHAFGDIVTICAPGAGRVVAPCAVAATCGGCQWQHVDYERQLAQKVKIATSALRDIAAPPPVVHGAVSPLAYRRRARLLFRVAADGVAFGFRARRGSELVAWPESGCAVLDPACNRASLQLREALAELLDDGCRGELSLLASPEGAVHVSLRVAGGKPPAAEALLATLDGVTGVVVHATKRQTSRSDRAGEPVELARGVIADADAFAQVAAAGEQRIAESLHGMLGDLTGRRVLELYSGAGTWTSLLRDADHVTAVERDRVALSRLRKQASTWGLNDLTCAGADAATFVRDLKPTSPFDLVLLDPPRTGAAYLKRLAGVARIVYVSCNPITFARDIKPLCQTYRLREWHLVDTTPQTSHFELVAYLDSDGVAATNDVA